MTQNSKNEFSDLIKGFAVEAREHILIVENELVNLENQDATTSADLIKKLFRAVHSIKGGAGFFDLNNIKKLSHHIESVFGLIRESKLSPSSSILDVLFRSVDKLKFLIDNTDDDAKTDISSECNDLEKIINGEFKTSTGVVPTIDKKETIEILSSSTNKKSESVKEQKDPITRGDETKPTSDDNVRISLGILDKLMNLASELVLIRNQNMQAIETKNLDQLASISQKLNIITSEFQATAMQTRMQPISILFGKFKRVVRDLAKHLGKEVEIEMLGSNVELDKTIIEAIGDSLIHIIRNSVDHGIESPSDRRAMGKPAKGYIKLSAYHMAGRVIIDIIDDGKGLDRTTIAELAVEKGIITKESEQKLSKKEIFDLIFQPGFSTASKITDVSGRGVGMDIVKMSIFKLGGSIDLKSEKGEGTTVSIKLPLTLAIMPALIVTVEEFCFAIPQVNVIEVAWLYGADVYQKLKKIDNQEVFWLRGKLLPILRLTKVLNITKYYYDDETRLKKNDRRREIPDRREQYNEEFYNDMRKGVEERRSSLNNKLFIVVLKVGSERYGLVVDEIIDNFEIVIKPLHDQLKNCGTYMGSTVLGNGRISLILDVPSLAELGKLDFTRIEKKAPLQVRSSEEKFQILLFKIGGDELFSVPLYMVSRIESVNINSIKRVNKREYLPFRNNVIPLIRLESIFSEMNANYKDDFFVLIPKCRIDIGIIVSDIVDNFEVHDLLDYTTEYQSGILGSMLLDEKLILFLDVPLIINNAEKNLFKKRNLDENNKKNKNVLILEDSAFYGQFIMSILRNEGITSIWAKNGEEALRILESANFDFILSDLEMPIMDGFEFARRIRKNDRYKDLRMWAFSSANIIDIEEKVVQAGFNGFQSKSNKDKLAKVIVELVNKCK